MSNAAPSRADPVVVFPLGRWCPPQETSQPHPSHTWGRKSTTFVMSIGRNDIKYKYMFLFPLNNVAGKGLIRGSRTCVCLTLTATSEPHSLKSSYFMTSAMMKPFSKSVWILPAAWGALKPFCKHKDNKLPDEYSTVNCLQNTNSKQPWWMDGWMDGWMETAMRARNGVSCVYKLTRSTLNAKIPSAA